MIQKIKKKRKTFDNQDSVILYNIYIIIYIVQYHYKQKMKHHYVSFYVFFEKNI